MGRGEGDRVRVVRGVRVWLTWWGGGGRAGGRGWRVVVLVQDRVHVMHCLNHLQARNTSNR